MRTSVMPQVQAGNTLAIPSVSELEGESRRDRSGSREGLPVRRSVGFLGRIHRPADAVCHPRGQRLNGVAPVSKLRHKRASREGN